MSRIERLQASVHAIRSYAAPTPEEDDSEQEAQGLAIAAANLAATHSDDELLDHCEDLYDGLGNLESDTRSYAGEITIHPPAGKTLVPSKRNPKVRRWVKIAALKHLGHEVGTSVAAAAERGEHSPHIREALAALHHAGRRETSLDKGNHESALHTGHYLHHHGEFVEKTAKKYGLHKHTVAHALAYHAKSELAKQRGTTGSMRNGKPQPLHNKDITDRDFHKNLGGRAKSAFIKGMIARHGA